MRRWTCLLVLMAVAAVTAPPGTTAVRPAQSPIDGLWQQTLTGTRQELIQELIDRGVPPKIAAMAPKLEKPALEFRAGRFRVLDLASGKRIGAGHYAVHDKSVKVVFTSAVVRSIVGRASWLTWSVYRDRLTFSEMTGRDGSALLVWRIRPWTRVR